MLMCVSILTDLRGKVKLEWVAEVSRGDNEQTIITRQKGELAGYLNYAFPDFLNIKGFLLNRYFIFRKENIIVCWECHQMST